MIGGGPAGSATALMLARLGHSVMLFEQSTYEGIRIGETLPPNVRKPLTRLGIWDRFLRDNHLPSFGAESAWGDRHLHGNDYIFSPYGPGWHVDRTRFDALLVQVAAEAGVQVNRRARVDLCTRQASGEWVIETTDREERRRYRAGFVVDATGRDSVVAQWQGSRRISYDHLIGAARFSSVSSSKPIHSSFTLVEAVEEGWWYMAVLPGFRVVAVYMTDADLYARASKVSNHVWQDQLQKAPHVLARTQGCRWECDPVVFSARTTRLDRTIGKNWLAVGDASAVFDPLSSQGVYKALVSGIQAAESIHSAWFGGETALEEYNGIIQRSFDNYLLIKKTYYDREKRWSDSPFWRRRQVAAP